MTPTFGARAVLRGTTSLIILALGSSVLTAQEQPQEGDGVFLGTLVLGESKRKVRTDTAVAETDIDQREISDRQAGTIAELIDSVPGVNLVNGSTPQGSGINIRGYGANSTFGADQKVAVQVDGASVGSEKLYRIGTQLFTDPLLYRSVNVIRGTVGNFEYGSGIVGGVVSLETKDASDFTGGQIGVAGGQTFEFTSNGDGFTTSTVLAWQPTENMEFLLNYVWRDQDNQTDGSGNTIGNSAFTLPSGLIKAKYTFGEARDQSLTLSYNRTTSSDRDVPYDSFQTTADAVDRDTDSTIVVAKYNYDPNDNSLINLDVTLSYSDQKIDQDYVPGSSILEGTPGFPSIFALVDADHRYETTKLLVKNTSLFETGAISHDLRTGVELMHRKRRDATAAAAAGGEDDRIAVFVVDEMRIGDGWTITPALRFESSKIKGATERAKNDALMGGLSVRYAFGNGLAVFGSGAYTEGLPIIDDLGTPAHINQSEKSQTFEIGASFERSDLFSSGDNLALKAVAYQTKLWDVTSFQIGRAGPTLDRIETEGLEIEASYAMDSGLYMDLNANIMNGTEYAPGLPSEDWRLLPADSVQFTLGKRFGEELDLSWEVVADGAIGAGADRTSAFGVHNLRATYIPQSGVLKDSQIRLGIENVFDRDYTPHLSTRPAPGRNVKLTLTRLF